MKGWKWLEALAEALLLSRRALVASMVGLIGRALRVLKADGCLWIGADSNAWCPGTGCWLLITPALDLLSSRFGCE